MFFNVDSQGQSSKKEKAVAIANIGKLVQIASQAVTIDTSSSKQTVRSYWPEQIAIQ